MPKTPKLAYNIIYNVAYQILSIIVPLITAPYVFRILGKDGIGLYGYSFSVAHYFTLFCMLGILNYGVREISTVSDNIIERSKKFFQIYSIQLISGVFSLLSYFLLVNSYVHEEQKIFLVQGIFVISAMLDVSWFLFGMENFRITTIISIINKVITTTCIFLFIHKQTDVYLYAAILSLGSLFNNIFYWIVIKKYLDWSFCDFSGITRHLKPILILFIPVIAINIYKYIDKIMLGAILDVSEVGIYEAAEKLQNFPLCLIAAFGTVMLPRISNLRANSKSADVNHYNMLSFVALMFVCFGMAFGLAGISESFIPLFYGEGYNESVQVLQWLLPSMIFVGWANIIRTQYLLPYRMDKTFCASVIVGAVINIFSNLLFIPIYGATGAAISTTFAEFTVCSYQSYVAYKDMNLGLAMKCSVPYILIGMVMYIIMVQIHIREDVYAFILRLVVGTVIYLALSLVYLNKFFPFKTLIKTK